MDLTGARIHMDHTRRANPEARTFEPILLSPRFQNTAELSKGQFATVPCNDEVTALFGPPESLYRAIEGGGQCLSEDLCVSRWVSPAGPIVDDGFAESAYPSSDDRTGSLRGTGDWRETPNERMARSRTSNATASRLTITRIPAKIRSKLQLRRRDRLDG